MSDVSIELYLVMQFIEGKTLTDYVGEYGKQTVDQAATFTQSLCDTVRLAHQENIVHRDIKPDNIIVNDPDKSLLYMVDYGLSFCTENADLTEYAETFKNKFLALPEANTPGGDRRDPRSDVTALCAVFYFMLTGHVPGQLVDANGRMPHLRPGYSVKEAIPNDARQTQVELILNRGLAPQSENRFQTVDEFVDRLSTLLELSVELTSADPFSLAQDFSVQLRQRDRKTQLAEFQPVARQLMDRFAKSIKQQYDGKLGRFRLGLRDTATTGPHVDMMDPLTNSYSLQLSVAHHSNSRQRVYRVASRGEQCVVLASDELPIAGNALPKTKKPKPTYSEWKEIGWYEGEPGDVIETMQSELRQWVAERLQDVHSEIITA